MPRIALLLDSLTVPAWVYESIALVMAEQETKIVLAVINKHPRSSGEKSPFLYRLYRAIDRWFFKKNPDAFESKILSNIPSWEVPTLFVTPLQKKFTDEFIDGDLEKISSYQPDLIVRFGFRILKGKILTLSPLGVWSYHHGDPALYRGGPPAFWEVMRQIPVTGVALLRLTEQLDQGPVLYHSKTQTDPLSVQRNANRLFWHSSTFLLRSIRRLRAEPDFWNAATPQPSGSPLWRPSGNRETLAWVIALLVRNFLRKIREIQRPSYWEVAQLELAQDSLFPEIRGHRAIQFRPKSSHLFWADPFPVTFQGKTYLLLEEFDQKKNKGSIACVLPDGSSRRVLEEDWHLSYPFVWEEGGEIYLIPESADAGRTYWYRAVDFPFRWERLGVLFDQPAYDPTLWKDETGYWLFANQKAHPACSPFDELFLYHTKNLKNPVWISHPRNPIVSDVGRSRPAGKLFTKDGKLYRPAQNSELRYGHGIRMQEILTLSLTDYEERTVEEIKPSPDDPFLGIHTINRQGGRAFVDFYFRA